MVGNKNSGRKPLKIGSVGRKPKQYLRKNESNAHRYAVAKYYQKHDMKATLAKFYPGLTGKHKENKRKLIYSWVKRIPVYQSLKTVAREQTRIRDFPTNTVLGTENELELVEWVIELRNEGVPVPGHVLKCKALELARENDIDLNKFKAGDSWLRGFLKRHKFSIRAGTRQGQHKPEDAIAKAHEFGNVVKQKMIELNVDVVWAADQTAVFMEYLSKTTITKKGEKTVWIRSAGKEKERVSVMVLGNSKGDKATPWIILKSPDSKKGSKKIENDELRNGFGENVWKKIEPLQNGARIYRNQKGWWNSYIHKKWLQFNWGYRADLKNNPILLLIDDFSGHWTADVIEYAKSINVVCLKVPEGYTCSCSPPDISWNAPIKGRLRKRWLESVFEQFKLFKNKKDEKFELKKPEREIIIGWVKSVWNEISKETIKSGFSKLGIIDEQFIEQDVDQSLGNEVIKEMNELVDTLINLRLNDEDFTIYNHDEDLFDGDNEQILVEDGDDSDNSLIVEHEQIDLLSCDEDFVGDINDDALLVLDEDSDEFE